MGVVAAVRKLCDLPTRDFREIRVPAFNGSWSDDVKVAPDVLLSAKPPHSFTQSLIHSLRPCKEDDHLEAWMRFKHAPEKVRPTPSVG